ncbi:myosin-binding protein 7-like [Zingiber officinale]|uniref:myosin-binding protein 7-like n=1 Tax=Zingiber officinale TaxID=94328 RepID=UPI001C4DCED0|nr:myosin-binding protein 7-like [Zingiber officinale]
MEARQFRRLAEEKMAHDQQEIAAVDDILFKRDQAVQALTCVVQAYRHRLLSYGIGVDEFDTPPSGPQTPGTATATPTCTSGSQFDAYPALRCADDSATDLDKYPSVETPRAADSPRDSFLHRNFQLERVRSGSFRIYKDTVVSVRLSPRRQWSYLRSLSYRSLTSHVEHPVDYASDYPTAVRGTTLATESTPWKPSMERERTS